MGSSSSHDNSDPNTDPHTDPIPDPNTDPITLFSAEDITDMIKDSSYYNPMIEINPLIFEEIRYKIASYLNNMLRNIEILEKYNNILRKIEEKDSLSPSLLYSNSPQKLYFPKKAISDQKYSDLLQENLEYYISELIDGALIIQKNNELMPGDIHTYALSLYTPDTLDKIVDLTQGIKAVLFEISPESTIDKEALETINKLINELAQRILSIVKKLHSITIDKMKLDLAVEIVFESEALRLHARLSKVLHFSPSKVREMVSYPISEKSLISLTSVLEYITAEILNVSRYHDPITKDDVIQGIQNDSELDTLFRYL